MTIDQQHYSPVTLPVHAPAHLVEVDGKTYQIVQIDPRSQPIPIRPNPIPSTVFDDPKTVIALGIGLIIVTGGLTWLVCKAFAPVPVVPAAPTAPAPSTVIVQPPAPEKHPYSRRECRATGLLGLGQDCIEERGYQ